MPWPPDIAGDLPAPRDDEPSSLRQDIADELADHLQSSFTRELHFTPEDAAARETVLDRFGDPRRVARQLWFDAMKEKIMSQRVNLVLSSVMTVACLGALALMGIMLRESRLATQQLLEQNQAANAALLEKLAGLAAHAATPAPVAEPAKSMEWNSVKLRLVKGETSGPPAEGFEVRLHGHLLDTAKEIDIVRRTEADGIADLGLVRPGQYELTVRSPWDEFRSKTQLTVLPGQPVTEEIVCPASDRVEAAASFSVEWPDDLRDKKLWVVGHVYQLGRELAGKNWSPLGGGAHLFIVSPSNTILNPPMIAQSGPNPFQFQGRGPRRTTGLFSDATDNVFRRRGAPNAAADQRPAYHLVFGDSPPQPEVRWPAAQYRLENVLIGEAPDEKSTDHLRTETIVGGLMTGFNRAGSWGQLLARSDNPQPGVPFSDWVDDHDQASGEYEAYQERRKAQQVFEIKTGGPNHVTIAIPPKLADHVRKFLEATK